MISKPDLLMRTSLRQSVRMRSVPPDMTHVISLSVLIPSPALQDVDHTQIVATYVVLLKVFSTRNISSRHLAYLVVLSLYHIVVLDHHTLPSKATLLFSLHPRHTR